MGTFGGSSSGTGGGSSGFGSKASSGKTTEAKQGTASKQLRSSLERIGVGQINPTLGALSNLKASYDQQKYGRMSNPVEDVGGSILALLNRPSQGVLRGVQAQQTGTDVSSAVLRGLRSGNGDPQINFRQALNTDNWQAGKGFISPEAEAAAGRQTFIDSNKQVNPLVRVLDRTLAGGTDLGAVGVTDPLSFANPEGLLSRGGSAGLRAVEKAAGADVAKQVARHGANSLDPAALADLRQRIMALPQAKNVRGGPEAFSGKLLGGEGNALTRQRGALEQAQGLRIAGKTVLPSRLIRDPAADLGLDRAAAKVAASRPVAGTADAFIPRAKVAREIGRTQAEDIGIAEGAMRGQVSEKLADIQRRFAVAERALPKGVDPDVFQREVVTPALEAGQHTEVAQSLRAAGRGAEATYLDATDQLRREITDVRKGSGLLKKEYDTNRYVPHQLSEAGQKAIAKIPEAQQEIMGYRPKGPSEFLAGTETKSRSFMPGATIAEKNAAIFEKYGIKDAYEPNAARALGKKAATTYDQAAKVDLVKKIGDMTDNAGTKLIHFIPDNSKNVRDLEVATKQQVRGIEKQIKKLEGVTKREGAADARKLGGTRVADAVTSRLATRVDALEAALRSAKSRRTAAGIESRATKEAGTATKAAPTRTTADIKSELREVLADPMIPDYIRAQIRKEYTSSLKDAVREKGFVQQRNAAESARAGGKAVQQRIGKSQASVRYENILTKVVERQLAQAQKDLEFAQRRSIRSKLSDNVNRDKLSDLVEQRKQLKADFREQKRTLKDGEKIDRPAGYVKKKMGPLGEAYMPEAVSKRLDEIEGKINSDPTAWNTISKAMGTGTQVMKNLVLNSDIALVARNTRDLAGNIPNMVANGFKDPGAFITAGKIQNAMNQAYRKGLSTEEAIASLPEKWQKYERALQETGALGAGQLRSDVTHGIGIGESKSLKARAKRAVDVRNAESIVTRRGARLNQQVDDVSRRAMMIDQINQHGDALEAAKATKNALFDYADLAPGEKALRKVIIFWTFTARNARMQAIALKNKPQIPLNIARAQQEAGGGDTGTTPIASYALAGNQTPLFSVGKMPILGTIQSPFDAASQSLQPLADIASFFLPEKYTTTRGAQGGLAELLSTNLGGTYGQAAKSTVETATGTDLRSGAPLQGTKGDQIRRALLQAAPRGSQINSLQRQGRSGTAAQRVTQALRLGGLTTTVASPQNALSETYARNRALQDSAERQGIPSLTVLKQTGKLKKPAK